MSFLNNYDEMLGFIYARHWYGFVPGACSTHKMVSTDLCRVKSIELDAALVLVADYHSSLLIQRNYKPYINDDQWLPEVRAVLYILVLFVVV